MKCDVKKLKKKSPLEIQSHIHTNIPIACIDLNLTFKLQWMGIVFHFCSFELINVGVIFSICAHGVFCCCYSLLLIQLKSHTVCIFEKSGIMMQRINSNYVEIIDCNSLTDFDGFFSHYTTELMDAIKSQPIVFFSTFHIQMTFVWTDEKQFFSFFFIVDKYFVRRLTPCVIIVIQNISVPVLTCLYN